MIDERYAAGFIDGEGCIRASRNIRVIVAGCFNPRILLLLQEQYGGNLCPYRAKKPKCRSGWRWEVTGKKAAKLLSDVLPHLIDKREQAEIALRYDGLRRAINCRGGKGHSAENKQQFSEMENRLRDLKRVQHCL